VLFGVAYVAKQHFVFVKQTLAYWHWVLFGGLVLGISVGGKEGKGTSGWPKREWDWIQ